MQHRNTSLRRAILSHAGPTAFPYMESQILPYAQFTSPYNIRSARWDYGADGSYGAYGSYGIAAEGAAIAGVIAAALSAAGIIGGSVISKQEAEAQIEAAIRMHDIAAAAEEEKRAAQMSLLQSGAIGLGVVALLVGGYMLIEERR